MALLRILIIFLLLWLLYRLVVRLLPDKKPTPPQQEPEGTQMVKCSYCGVHLPQERALQQGERYYCCELHRAKEKNGEDGESH